MIESFFDNLLLVLKSLKWFAYASHVGNDSVCQAMQLIDPILFIILDTAVNFFFKYIIFLLQS